MNDRQLEIEVFLKQIANNCEKNKQLDVSEDYVYGLLEKYGLTDEELEAGQDYKHIFEFWEDNFRDKQNIRVFCSPQQRNFLQFHNNRNTNAEFMKLYISIASESIFSCVDNLFKFMESENIEHASKVSSKTRSDSIVLRIRKKEDVIKVINYINSNPLLSYNGHPTNPFLMRQGIVGMAYDNQISYNALTSYFVSEYIKGCQKANRLENVSFNDFVGFLFYSKDYIFQNKKGLKEFLNSYYVQSNAHRLSGRPFGSKIDNSLIVNFQDVLELLIDNVTKADNINNYFEKYKESINPTHKRQSEEKIELLQQEEIINKHVDTEVIEDGKKVLDDFIEYSASPASKYKTPRELLLAIEGFSNGNVRNITRDFNFRQRFINSLDKDRINAITSNNLADYIRRKLNKSENNYDNFINACKATMVKYGREHLRGAINKAINGYFMCFTNSMGNYRSKIERMTKEEVLECVEKLLDTNALYFDRDIGIQCVEKLEEGLTINAKTSISK